MTKAPRSPGHRHKPAARSRWYGEDVDHRLLLEQIGVGNVEQHITDHNPTYLRKDPRAKSQHNIEQRQHNYRAAWTQFAGRQRALLGFDRMGTILGDIVQIIEDINRRRGHTEQHKGHANVAQSIDAIKRAGEHQRCKHKNILAPFARPEQRQGSGQR